MKVLPALLCLAAMFLFAASDVIAKHLSVTFHPLQIAWFRYLVASLFLAGVCLRFGRPAPVSYTHLTLPTNREV